jgi:hypothetical protein
LVASWPYLATLQKKYIQASWQKEIFSVDLFFPKARFFGFLLNSNRKALAVSISDNLLSLAAHRATFEFVRIFWITPCIFGKPKQTMLRIADHYDRLVAQAEERATPKPPAPSLTRSAPCLIWVLG